MYTAPLGGLCPAGLVPISHSRSTIKTWLGWGGGIREGWRSTASCCTPHIPSSLPLCSGLCLIIRNIKITFTEHLAVREAGEGVVLRASFTCVKAVNPPTVLRERCRHKPHLTGVETEA